MGGFFVLILIFILLFCKMEEDNVKLQFIQNALTQYGEDVMANMVKEINRLDAKDTEALLKSITYKVVPANQFAQGEVKIIFKEYGRMVDMGVGRGRSQKIHKQIAGINMLLEKLKNICTWLLLG